MASAGAFALRGRRNLRIIRPHLKKREYALAKSEWSFRTAVELSAALAARKVSAVELAQDVIDRIERYDAKVNAICVRDFERGLAAARAADAELARGVKKPLLGLPLTVKESYNVAGLPTTWGIPAQKDFTPTEDALPISRVKDAGGVILGKTNVPLSLGDWQSYNDIYGTTNNPFDLGRTPGGSSVVHRLRSRRGMARCRSAPTSAARCACRRSTAASMRTSRPSTWWRCAATRRRPCRRCRPRATSA